MRVLDHHKKYVPEFGNLNLPTVSVRTNRYDRVSIPVLVPVIDHPDARILEQVERDPRRWEMSWYAGEKSPGCGSSHCMAGWLIHICGVQGYELVAELRSDMRYAAELIYGASCPGLPVPSFRGPDPMRDENPDTYNAHHLELLRQRAAADPLPPEGVTDAQP